MNRHGFDDATLMAYADGALDSDAARLVAEAAEGDSELAARIRMFRETGELLGALGAARPHQPLPDDLTERVERTVASARREHTVVPMAARRPPWRPVAFAASVALVVGVIGGIVASLALRGPEPSGAGLAVFDTPGMERALESLPAGARGQADGGRVEIIASFLTQDGVLCREFEFEGADASRLVSVACREGENWITRFVVATQGADDASYQPASSLAALDAYLSAIGAGPPMSQEEEAARLSVID